MICVIKECELSVKAKSLCHRHLRLFYKGDDLGKHINRDKQEITVDGDVAYIQIYDKVGGKKERAIIDSEDIAKVSPFKWHSSRKYVVSRSAPSNKFIRLHRLIMNCADSSVPFIDHKNNNPLDNRKANLRSVDFSKSAANTRPNLAKPVKYKGVFFSDSPSGKLRKKYRVRISSGDSAIEVGRFETAEEAAWMYDQFASQIWEDHAWLNFTYS